MIRARLWNAGETKIANRSTRQIDTDMMQGAARS
jgi:hypothetical protein